LTNESGKEPGEAARRRFREEALPHLDDAYSLARWLAGNRADAEDIVQDACLRALQASPERRVENPRAWLLTIVRNAAYSWFAKNRPATLVLAGGPEDAETRAGATAPSTPAPDAALIEAADRRAVNEAIEALPLAFKETLIMREANGLSYREISEATGVPIGTVMSRLARARAMLIDKLGASS
jgi:RNA polymerase sigma factor (sigma-70 family)